MRISSIIKPFVILLGVATASQLCVAQEKIKGLYYNYKPELGGYELTGPPKSKKDKSIKLEIPSSVKGKAGQHEVKAVAKYAYSFQHFKELIFNGVNTISSNAFAVMEMDKDLYIDAYNICEEAFEQANIKGCITLSRNVTSIASNAFYHTLCNGFIVEEGNKKFCAIDGMLFTADTSKIIAVPYNHPVITNEKSVQLPRNLKSIGESAFDFYNLRRKGNDLNIILPPGISEVRSMALNLNCLGAVTLLTATPPSAPTQTVKEEMYSKVMLVVPPRSVTRYKKHSEWGKF